MAESTEKRNPRSRSDEVDGQPQRQEEEEPRDDKSSDDEPRDEAREDDTQRDDEASDEGGDESGSGGDRSGARLSAKELTEAAVATIADLTGFDPESVAGLQWDGESWLVTIDVLELARIPNTTDVLASYVVQLDDSGALLGYKRTRRFLRSQVEDE